MISDKFVNNNKKDKKIFPIYIKFKSGAFHVTKPAYKNLTGGNFTSNYTKSLQKTKTLSTSVLTEPSMNGNNNNRRKRPPSTPAPHQPPSSKQQTVTPATSNVDEEFVDEDVFLDETLLPEDEESLILRDIKQRQAFASRLSKWARPPLSPFYVSQSQNISESLSV